MTLYKHVAGLGNVEMSPEEEADFLAKQESDEAARQNELSQQLADGNGEALTERRRSEIKASVESLIEKGEVEKALKQMMELIK